VLVTLWSVKGGSGTSTVAAGLATVASRSSRGPGTGSTLLVDLAGDQPSLLGLPVPTGPGALDWLATDGGDADALRRLEVASDVGPALVPAGTATEWGEGRPGHLVEVLVADGRTVVVDAGTVVGTATPAARDDRAGLARSLADAGTSLLVVRPCYLALRRAVAWLSSPEAVRVDGVVLVEEPGRALDATDVARAVGVPVRATVPIDPAVARAVDAGLLTVRLPRSFGRALTSLVPEVGG
jgi:hypothetical protein